LKQVEAVERRVDSRAGRLYGALHVSVPLRLMLSRERRAQRDKGKAPHQEENGERHRNRDSTLVGERSDAEGWSMAESHSGVVVAASSSEG
jgi:hypothetical protein